MFRLIVSSYVHFCFVKFWDLLHRNIAGCRSKQRNKMLHPRPLHALRLQNKAVNVGSSSRAVERRTVNRGDGGSIPPTAVSKLMQFHSPHICLCLSEEILKADGPFLSSVYARGSKRSHTGGKFVTCNGLTNSRERQLLH